MATDRSKPAWSRVWFGVACLVSFVGLGGCSVSEEEELVEDEGAAMGADTAKADEARLNAARKSIGRYNVDGQTCVAALVARNVIFAGKNCTRLVDLTEVSDLPRRIYWREGVFTLPGEKAEYGTATERPPYFDASGTLERLDNDVLGGVPLRLSSKRNGWADPALFGFGCDGGDLKLTRVTKAPPKCAKYTQSQSGSALLDQAGSFAAILSYEDDLGTLTPIADDVTLAERVSFLSTCVVDGLLAKKSVAGRASKDSCCSRELKEDGSTCGQRR